MIQVRNHWNESGDGATLSGRRCGVNRDIGITRKVAATTDTIHHLRAANVSRVDVAENISLKSSIDGDQAHTTSKLRVVGDFLRAKHNLILKEIHMVDDVLKLIRTNCERATGSKFAASLLHQTNNGILNHLGVHLKSRDMLILAECPQNGISHVAYTRLNG